MSSVLWFYGYCLGCFDGLDSELLIIYLKIYKSGQLIRKTQANYKHIWWNYWDYCPRDENDYLVHLNYLLLNPIKHGYTDNLNDYPFSSFHQLLAETGREALTKQFTHYSLFGNVIY